MSEGVRVNVAVKGLSGMVVLLLLANGEAVAAAGEGVDFTGSWELDYQRSDQPNEKIRWLYVQAKAKAARELQRARNDRHYRVDPRLGNTQAVIGLGRLAEKIAAATVFTIQQEQDHIVIKRNDDFALICDFNAREATENPFGKEDCSWRGKQLSFLTVLPDGLVVQHLFSLLPGQRRLNVATTVRISGVSYPFTLNQTYVPFDPGEGMYDCEYTIANQTTCTLVRRNR